MTKIFNARLYDRFVEIQIQVQSSFKRKKLHRTNQGSNYLRGSFSNRDVAAPNLEDKDNPSLLKKLFFLKNRPIHYHLISAGVIRPVKRNNLSFSSVENDKSLPLPQSLQMFNLVISSLKNVSNTAPMSLCCQKI